MAIDRTTGTDTTVETAEKPPAPDRVPPPDDPGNEPPGVPSRADSRAAASANKETQATEAQTEQSGEDKPGVNQPPAEIPDDWQITVPADHEDSPTPPLDEPAGEDGQGTEADQQPNLAGTAPGDGTPDSQQAPEPTAATIENTDQPQPVNGKDLDIDEQPVTTDVTAETQPAEPARPFDDPGNEPEGVPSRADIRAAAAAANTEQTTGKPQVDEQPGQAADTAPTTNIPGELSGTPEVDDPHKDQEPPADMDLGPSTDTTHDAQLATDQPQPDTDDQPDNDAPPVAAIEANGAAATDLDKATDPLDETPQDPESAEGAVDITAQLEPRADPAEPESQDGAPEDAARAVEDRSPALEFMVETKLVRAYGDLDTIGDQDQSNDIGDKLADPADRAGERIAGMEGDKLSRREKMRMEGYRASEDVGNFTKKTLRQAQDLFGRPPIGEAKISTSSPEIIRPPHDGVHVADSVTSLMVAGAVVGELYRWVQGKLARDKKEG